MPDTIAECVASALPESDESKCIFLHSAETPQHTVYLNAFWIDKTEVTNAQYRKCVEAGVCQEPDSWDDNGGRGTIRIWRQSLVIRNNIEVHEKIGGPFYDKDF